MRSASQAFVAVLEEQARNRADPPIRRRRSPNSKRSFTLVGPEQLGPPAEKPAKCAPRVCLRCDRSFDPENKFMRLCKPCRVYVTFLDGPGVEAW